MRRTPATRRRMLQQVASAIVLAIGLLLMAVKIRADSEPGAIPLALVLVGTAWLVIARWHGRWPVGDGKRLPRD